MWFLTPRSSIYELMTLTQEYERMRPVDEDASPATVWGSTHSRGFDPIPFLLKQAEKASAWVAAERKFFVGPGSGRPCR
jgi:hypothetical protein